MKLNELKSELKEIEKQFNNPAKEKGRTSGARVLTNLSTYNQEIKKTKIEYLKKGISACEEILNSQQTKPCRALATKKPDRTEDGSSYTKDKTADTEQEKAEGVVYPKGDSDTSPVQTLIKQALSQRNQEILKIIDKLKMKHTKEHGGCGDPSECCFNRLDVLDWDFFDELKQQLSQLNSEEEE